MARPPSWLRNPDELKRIRKTVAKTKRTHYDSRAIEELFDLQPRAASNLVNALPQGDPLGRSRLVERKVLAEFLEEVNDTNWLEVFAKWKAKTAKVSRKKPRLLVRRELLDGGSLDSLPETITLTPGQSVFRFESRLELMESIATLLGAVENNTEEFIQKYCPKPGNMTVEQARQEAKAIREMFEDLRQREANRDKKVN